MNSKEKSIIFVIENMIEALNDIYYEMENFNAEDGFSLNVLKSYISNAEKGFKDVINNIEGGIDV